MRTFDHNKVHVTDEHAAQVEALGLASIAGVKAFSGERVKAQRGRRDVFRVTAKDATGRAQVLFLKRHWQPYKKDGLASLVRRGRVWSIARQEWENSRALENAGLRVAGLVAYGEECGPLWEKFSFIITKSAAGRTVDEFVRDVRDPATRRRVLDALASQIRRIHDSGLASKDLFTRHIFVERENDQPQFSFIDMAHLDQRATLSERKRARDLAALNVTAPLRFVSARERVRFLRVYAGGDIRPLTRLIAKRVERLLRRRKFKRFLGETPPKSKPTLQSQRTP